MVPLPLRPAVLLVSLLAGCPREAVDPPASAAETAEVAESSELSDLERAAITDLLEAQRLAWNRGDLDGFLVAYEPSDRLLFTSGTKIRRGFAETRAKYRERYGSATETMGQLEFELLDIRGLGSHAAIVLGRYRLSGTPEAGDGVFTIVLERQAEHWRIVHDHTSAAPSTPAP